MFDSTFGVDVGAGRAVVAVQEDAGWGTINVDLEDFPADLVSRVGDRQPCVRLADGGFRLRPAHEMYVDAVERALVVAGSRLHRPVEGPVGIAVPSWWTERAASWTLGALTARGLENLRLVNAAEAAVVGARAAGLPVPGEVLVVDVGARSSSATVVSGSGQRPAVVPGANAVHLEGGEALDRLVLHRVVANLAGLGVELDVHDPGHVAAALAYLDDCREIRHELSVRSAVAAAANLPGSDHQLRIVRDEFEELAASWRNEVVRIALVAVTQAPRPVQAVLLVGGLSRTPLIGQAMSAALDLEVIAVPEPDLVVAYGAACAAGVTEEPGSLWARSRARFARGWLRRANGRAIAAPTASPLALPAGSSPVVAEPESPSVTIEQVPNEPIALGPAEPDAVPDVELVETGPAPEQAAEQAAEPDLEPDVEPVETEPAAEQAAEPDLEPDVEPVETEPAAEHAAEPEPEPDVLPVREVPVSEEAARDEAVLDLVQAFVPSQRTGTEGRSNELAGLMLVGSRWVRVPSATDDEEPDDGRPEDLRPDPAPDRRIGRRRRRSRRSEVPAGIAGLDALFDEHSGDAAGHR